MVHGVNCKITALKKRIQKCNTMMIIQYCPKAEEFEDHLGELEIFLVFMKTVLVRVFGCCY